MLVGPGPGGTGGADGGAVPRFCAGGAPDGGAADGPVAGCVPAGGGAWFAPATSAALGPA